MLDMMDRRFNHIPSVVLYAGRELTNSSVTLTSPLYINMFSHKKLGEVDGGNRSCQQFISSLKNSENFEHSEGFFQNALKRIKKRRKKKTQKLQTKLHQLN